jgi:hypothetical protein
MSFDSTRPGTVALVAICGLTGEPPRWRWGEEGDR